MDASHFCVTATSLKVVRTEEMVVEAERSL